MDIVECQVAFTPAGVFPLVLENTEHQRIPFEGENTVGYDECVAAERSFEMTLYRILHYAFLPHENVEPSREEVLVYRRPQYGPVEDAAGKTAIIVAEQPEFPLGRCKADAGMIADIVISKVCDHPPLYRQAKRSVREGDREGYVQLDAATYFDALFETKPVIECGCLAHGRRKFENSLSSSPFEAAYVLGEVGMLYKIETKANDEQFSAGLAKRCASCDRMWTFTCS